ncbi:MAG TPA: inositol monophosphatase family protein [Baekduia sp.]|nr:inositol monophosphatase family protein [Baekduia sp.]
MPAAHPALAHDWLGACRAAAEGLRTVLADHPTSAERLVETGELGGGGDRTLVIDQLAEDRVFEQLERLHGRGARFTAISEERGRIDFGDDQVLVVVDPIDGSLNAKRGLTHHALSIAVADGPTMGDVAFGYVLDLGPGEEWVARRGHGAMRDGIALAAPPERRTSDGKLEIVAVESADPRWLAHRVEELADVAHRLRAIGAMAISVCQVAAARVDGMVSLWRTRAVDVAAAQLVVRESGGHVAFVGAPGPLEAPLDLEPHFPIVATRTPEALAELAGIFS